MAIRTAMQKLGGSLLEDLLALDAGHRGPRVDCGQGHGAEFVGYRPKHLDTVVGPATLRRAYYHCTECGHGVVPSRFRPLSREVGARAVVQSVRLPADDFAEPPPVQLTSGVSCGGC